MLCVELENTRSTLKGLDQLSDLKERKEFHLENADEMCKLNLANLSFRWTNSAAFESVSE